MTLPRKPPAAWMQTREKGSVVAMRVVLWIAALVGRKPMAPMLYLIALWYALLYGSVRRASAGWLRRVLGCEPRWRDVVRHIWTFSRTVLDRCLLLQGQTGLFEIRHFGQEHLQLLRRQQRGAILLSAHLGSAAAMGADANDERFRIHVVGYFKNAQLLNSVLAAIRPTSAARVVHLEPGDAAGVLELRERVEAGDLLAIAGDRVGLNDRSVVANFMGGEAPFPAGPFLLAALMRCPVYLSFGLYKEPNCYDLWCEPFAECIDLPRAERDAALRAYVQRYADRLAHFAASSPYNWFNFFDFWGPT